MSLNVISRDIISKAQKEKQLLEEALNEEMSLLELQSKERIDSFSSDLSSKYDTEFNASKIKILGKYQKEAKTIVLDSKTKILNDVYNKTLEKIDTLNDIEKQEILVKLLKLAKDLIHYDSIETNKDDLKFIKTKVSEKINVTSKENLKGLIFHANNGKEILNLSFEVLFRDIIAKNEEKIQNMLFN